MTPLKMARLHFKRQKLQSTLIVLSLALALSCSSLLLRIYGLSQSRYRGLPSGIEAIVGPKSGGIEILLGAFNAESKFHGSMPENLFQTLRAGADVRFEDGTVVSSKSLTQVVIPISFFGGFKSYPLISTDTSFLSLLNQSNFAAMDFPAVGEAWVGTQLAEKERLAVGKTISVDVRGANSKKTIEKKLKISKIIEKQSNTWDQIVLINQESALGWIRETEGEHPVWKDKIINYALIKMNFSGFRALQTLINDRTVAQMIWVDTEKQKLEELSSSAKDLGAIIVIVIFALAGFSIFGMMSIRFQGLRISIATLEAIGFLPKYIYSWILYEALLVGLAASGLAVVIQIFGFSFVKLLLSSTWLIPVAQSNDFIWSLIIIFAGIVFSSLGALVSILQIVKIQIHSELKTG